MRKCMSQTETQNYLEYAKDSFNEAYEDGNLVRCLVIFDELKEYGYEEEASALFATKSEESLAKQLSGNYEEPPKDTETGTT